MDPSIPWPPCSPALGGMSVNFTAAVSFVRSSPLRLPHLRPPHCIAVVPHCLPNSLRPRLQHLYPETAADATVFNYVDGDPSFLSEQPDDGAQEPDDAIDVYYYPEDAYYYVKTADD
ncbi:uncharacterized protein LOC125541665 [Triticum urartu]|uniref:uncharacterized protein LOC125541665 n=1 Tax=Triticum urartu TaxID=4572 RepID=UPI0020436AC9|nr:uncharacterized protein LOC125541665 [Triticum urartu]